MAIQTVLIFFHFIHPVVVSVLFVMWLRLANGHTNRNRHRRRHQFVVSFVNMSPHIINSGDCLAAKLNQPVETRWLPSLEGRRARTTTEKGPVKEMRASHGTSHESRRRQARRPNVASHATCCNCASRVPTKRTRFLLSSIHGPNPEARGP